nr:hypothetical protein [Methanocorpusculum sp.]
MSLCNYGTNRPHDSLAELWRSGVVLLAALLLVCTLMAGAVSATGLSYSTQSGVLYEITAPGEYTLSDDITESGSNETLILISANDVTLDGGGQTITGSESTKYGIKVADGKKNVEIFNFKNITDVSNFGIWVGNSTWGWELGTIKIHDVTIGDVQNSQSDTAVQSRAYGIAVFSKGNNNDAITLTNCAVTGKISSARALAIQIVADAGNVSVIGCSVTGVVMGTQTEAQGIFIGNNNDDTSTTNITIQNCLISGEIKSEGTGNINIQGILLNQDYVRGVIDNCSISGKIFAPYIAVGIYAENKDDSASISINNCKITTNAEIKGGANAIGISANNYPSSSTTFQVSNCEVSGIFKAGNHWTYGIFAAGTSNIANCTVDAEMFEIDETTEMGGAIACISMGATTGDYVVKECSVTNVPNNYRGVRIGYEGTPSPINSIEIIKTLITPKKGSTTAKGIDCYQSDTAITNSITLSENTIQTPQKITFTSGGQITPEKIISFDLLPGVNTSGVTWETNSDKSYNLTISKSGSYKLMDSFSLAKMVVNAEDTTIDGSADADVVITVVDTVPTNGSDYGLINLDQKNTTLTNINITASENTDFTPHNGKIVHLAGENSKLTNSILDLSNAKTTSSPSRTSFMTVIAQGTNAEVSGTTIKAGNAKEGYSSSQCIVVIGADIQITGNTLIPGTSAEYKDVDSPDAVSSGSVGVRLNDWANNVKITGNTFISTQEDASMNNGISIDGVTQGVTVTANDNKFTLSNTRVTREPEKKGDVGGFGNAFYINPGADNIEITLNVKGNKVESGTNFLYLDDDNGERTTGYTVKGTIEENDYHPITGANIHTKVPAESSLSFAVTTDELDVKDNNYEMGEDPNPPKPVVPSTSSSGDGNMNNAFRVLFDTSGGSYVSPATGLSYGDRVAEPANPVKD